MSVASRARERARRVDRDRQLQGAACAAMLDELTAEQLQQLRAFADSLTPDQTDRIFEVIASVLGGDAVQASADVLQAYLDALQLRDARKAVQS